MTPDLAKHQSAKSLQDRLHDEIDAGPLRPSPVPTFSRAAALDLVDILSRRSGLGLATVTGATIWLAATFGAAEPISALAWLIMMMGALWFCHSYRNKFRSGVFKAGRPFRWRATYTAGLSVLGTVFSCAPLMLASAGATESAMTLLMGVTFLAAATAAIAHAAHITSALAFSVPTAIAILIFSIREFGVGNSLPAASASILLLVSSFLVYRISQTASLRRNPRTTVLRREIIDDRRSPAVPARQISDITSQIA